MTESLPVFEIGNAPRGPVPAVRIYWTSIENLSENNRGISEQCEVAT